MMIAKYYAQITFKRMAELLEMSLKIRKRYIFNEKLNFIGNGKISLWYDC